MSEMEKSSNEETQNKSSSASATEQQTEKLKDVDIRWRSKYKGKVEEFETLKVQFEKEKNELSSTIEPLQKGIKMYEEKFIEAKLESAAVSAGIKDVEFIKLIDRSELKLSSDGKIEGLEKIIQDFKSRKPDCFGVEKKTSSSSNAAFPKKEEATFVDARKLSKEEWRKNKSRYMQGDF